MIQCLKIGQACGCSFDVLQEDVLVRSAGQLLCHRRRASFRNGVDCGFGVAAAPLRTKGGMRDRYAGFARFNRALAGNGFQLGNQSVVAGVSISGRLAAFGDVIDERTHVIADFEEQRPRSGVVSNSPLRILSSTFLTLGAKAAT